jgi:multidrug efflux pump subunit AcrA (membrane-fusion protein)
MQHSKRWIVVVLIIAGLQLAACTPDPATPVKTEPAHIEHIEGTDLSRVVLTEKAAERLDIQTAPVLEQQATRKRTVGAQVVALPEAEVTDLDEVWVRVSLNESDLDKVDPDQPVLVLLLDDEDEAEGWMAEPDEGPGVDDPEDEDEDDLGEEEDEDLYYLIDSAEHGLAAGQRVFVELTLLGSATQLKVIPYAAVLYDLHGETWAYTSPELLVYVRQPIIVDYIDGDLAVLSDGPPAGTQVVMAGAAELFGAEAGIGGGGH